MTAHNDLDRQLNDFFRDGPTELPYESFDAVRDRTEQTGQRVVIGPWRLPEMNKILTIGLAAAAVVVAVLVGAQFLVPVALIGAQVDLFGGPEAGLGFFVHLPEGGMPDRKEHEAVAIGTQDRFRKGGCGKIGGEGQGGLGLAHEQVL